MDRKRIVWGVLGLVVFAVVHYYRDSDARACERELKYQIRMAPETKDAQIATCVETIRFMRDHHLQ